MKVRRSRVAVVVALFTMAVSIPLAGAALAATATVTGNISGDPVNPGEQATLTFTIAPSSRTLASFTLSPPAGWQLVAGSPSPGAPTYQVVDNALVASGLAVSGSGSATVQFAVKTGCASGNWTWGLVARDSQGRIYGNDASDLTTNVSSSCTLGWVTQPNQALKTKLITGTAFDDSGNFVAVELLNGAATPQRVTYFPVSVTFDLATGTGLAAGSLSAATKATVDGVATFSGAASTLQITTPNEPLYTDYKLKPKTVGTYAGLSGPNSSGFDIWDAQCSGPGCNARIRNDLDTYTATGDDVLTASVVPASFISNLSCAGQVLIFSSDVFVHATDGTEPVFLKSHVTRQNMKEAANNGQAHVTWCMGLKDAGPWGFTQQDTNGSGGIDPNDLYVGTAPACPNSPSVDPSDFAPCITRQYGDGNGGSWTEGYVPGGDPPRRT